MTPQKILLASHGTPGAKAAEQAALDLCAKNGAVYHLEVVPNFWKGMMGDDWLNNAATQARFGRYLETQLEKEIAAHAQQLAKAAQAKGLAYENRVVLGDPASALLEAASLFPCDLAVIGAPRPKGVDGYRSRMKVETLIKALSLPLLIVPHPGR